MNRINYLHQNSKWHFGKYQDIQRNLAFLVIYFPIEGKRNLDPLVLPFSKVKQTRFVINALLDSGVEFATKKEEEFIGIKLQNLDVTNGRFLQKIGHFDGVFLLPPNQIGDYDRQILVDPEIVKSSCGNFETMSTFEEWTQSIAKLMEKSSYMVGAVCITLAAPCFNFLTKDENTGYNFCGRSGTGKSTVLNCAKSVLGSPKTIPVWNQTFRSTAELAAAHSDCPLIIDDFEKLQISGNKSQAISQLTHMLASGKSKNLAKAMGKTYIPLEWSCPVITASPVAIEQLALQEGYKRSDGDRCRGHDFPIPDNDGMGIWDRMEEGDNPDKMSRDITDASFKCYGTLFPQWLERLIDNQNDFLEEMEDYVEVYMSKYTSKSNNGYEYRIARKFAINYAAGMYAIDLGLLTWEPRTVLESILKLHNLALDSVQTEEQMLNHALNSVNENMSDHRVFPTVHTFKDVSFKTRRSVSGFILDNKKGRYLYITKTKLLEIVGGPVYNDYFLKRMKQINALKKGSNDRYVCQSKVTVRKKSKRIWFYKIELDAFDGEFS